MIVVIFVSARAHMRYLRCSLVVYGSSGQFHNVTASAVCAPLRQNKKWWILTYTSLQRIIFNIINQK